MMYDHEHENEVTYFARTNFRNQLTKFGIKTDDRRRHVYIIGKTGMGKTTLMENMFLSDIYAGHGCCYVDPHGDTAEKLLDYIPSWRMNDIVYFNPSDMEFPVGFNILEAVDERHKHLVASGMMGVFKKIWENMWSSRMEYILNNTILALLDNPGSTLLGINRMLSDAEYRKKIVANVQDPIVRQFWLTEFASYNEKYAQEAVAPIQNKIGQFLSAAIVRNIVAQVKSSVDVRSMMDESKIFIVNLSKGRMGEDNSRLLGGMLITKIQLAAMERVDMPEADRRDFYLYVDEFQNFAVESFASILSEARKYRLCLTMAHQYIEQLSEEVRDAVFGNVGTIITYRVGSPDAEFLEKEFTPRFLLEDIINLPKFNVYMRLLIDGVASQPFSAITLPPIAQRTQSETKVIQGSRERYAHPRAVVEEKIMKWSGMEGLSDDEMYEKAKERKKAAKDSKKPRFEYKCSRCNKDIVLPVELDRSRPIYCSECIEIIRDERKDGRDHKKARRVDEAARIEPPKVGDGQLVERLPEEPSVTLDALAPVVRPPTVPRAEPPGPVMAPPRQQSSDAKASPRAERTGPVRLPPRPVGLAPLVSSAGGPPPPATRPSRVESPVEKPKLGSGQTITLGSLEPRPPRAPIAPRAEPRPQEQPKKKKRKRKKPGGAGSGSAGKNGDVRPPERKDGGGSGGGAAMMPDPEPLRLDRVRFEETNFAKGKLNPGDSVRF